MLVDELHFAWGPPFSNTCIYSLKGGKKWTKNRETIFMIRSWVTKLQKRERGENKYFCWDSADSYIIKSAQALGG